MSQTPHFRPSRLACVVVASALTLGSSCPPIQVQPSSITVEGRVRGVNGIGGATPDAVLTLQRAANGGPRSAYRRSVAVQDVQGINLAATASTGLPVAEEWHLLHLSRTGQRPGADPVIVDTTGDPGWVRAHVGDLAWVTIRKDDISLPSDSFTAFPSVSIRPGGATVLARVEDNDPVLPWTDGDGCNPVAALPLTATLRALAPPGGVDCFDMQSLASIFFNASALAVTNAANSLFARAVQHRLAIAPHVETPALGGNPPAPGVAFVYQADLEPVVGGSFTGRLTVSVPITLVWTRLPPGGTLATTLDPLGPFFVGGAPLNNARVTVTANDGSLAAGFAEALRNGVTTALAAAPLPTGPGGIPITTFLDLLFTVTVLDNAGLPVGFSVLALPADRTVSGAPRNIALSMGEITVTDITPTPAAGGAVGARTVAVAGDGSVVVLVNLTAGGTTARRFGLPIPTEPMPFNLVVLR